MSDLNPCLKHPDSEVMPKSHRCLECINEYNEENREHLRVTHEQAEQRLDRQQRFLACQRLDISQQVYKSAWGFMQRTEAYGWGAERSPISTQDIHNLFMRQEGECAGCFESFQDTPFQIEHIVPVAHGGKHNLKNLQLLCEYCNKNKGDSPHEDWISRVRYRQVVDYLMALENLEVE